DRPAAAVRNVVDVGVELAHVMDSGKWLANGMTRSTCGDPVGDAGEMSLHEAGDEERDRDRRDDPSGAARARLPLREFVRRRLFVQWNVFVCSKHAFV